MYFSFVWFCTYDHTFYHIFYRLFNESVLHVKNRLTTKQAIVYLYTRRGYNCIAFSALIRQRTTFTKLIFRHFSVFTSPNNKRLSVAIKLRNLDRKNSVINRLECLSLSIYPSMWVTFPHFLLNTKLLSTISILSFSQSSFNFGHLLCSAWFKELWL